MKKDTTVEVDTEKTEYTKTEKGSKSYEETMSKLDKLEAAHNKVVRTARLLGMTEGSLATLGVLGLGILVKNIINRR